MKTCFLGVVALSVCLGASAHATPRTINDCEKIEAADAYNQCLALFGPPAHKGAMNTQDGAEGRGAERVELQDQKPASEAAEPESPARHGRHSYRHVSRHHHGGRHYAHHGRHRHVSRAFANQRSA